MPSSSTPTPTPSSSPSSDNVKECLSQFTLNAPSNPSAYPCSTCLPILSNMTNNVDAANAVQFCGLRAILESTSTTGQTALSNGGWSKDLRVCTWSGVSCSDSGLITSLKLTFPAVPALIPTEIAALSQLQSLQVIGDDNSPAGVLPDSFRNLTSLTALHLESTAITTIPHDLFSLLTKVTDLTLIANGKFAGDLTSITALPLRSLVIKNQRLTNPIESLAASQSLQSSLLVLDLSSNSLSGSIPASISSLAALTQLHLDNNNLGQAVPGSFPHSLQSLTISNNTNLSGAMPADLCSSIFLKECDLRGTSVNKTNGCGICQF
ncbi:L domain-like protein [Thelephora ganbajun]|uniref:L domain-like protein n=1 Tax=Thelephora ganbajun TaxID=370292 RepID=A0ACB6ZTQ5_THEGA|nr:L domain-like protein [Thelephora ganbajun]